MFYADEQKLLRKICCQHSVNSLRMFVQTIDWEMRKRRHDNTDITWPEAITLWPVEFADDLPLLCNSTCSQQKHRCIGKGCCLCRAPHQCIKQTNNNNSPQNNNNNNKTNKKQNRNPQQPIPTKNKNNRLDMNAGEEIVK